MPVITAIESPSHVLCAPASSLYSVAKYRTDADIKLQEITS